MAAIENAVISMSCEQIALLLVSYWLSQWIGVYQEYR